MLLYLCFHIYIHLMVRKSITQVEFVKKKAKVTKIEPQRVTGLSKYTFQSFNIFFIAKQYCSIEISLVPLGVRIFEVGFLTLTMIFIYSVGRNVLVNTDGIRSRSLGMERVPCPTDIPKRTLPQSRVRFPSYSCFSSYNITRLG